MSPTDIPNLDLSSKEFFIWALKARNADIATSSKR